MGVGLGLAVRADVPMHIEIGDHAAIDHLALDECAGELNGLGLIQLARKGELDLARQLGVLARLAGLDRVPQPFTVRPLLRRAVRQHHLGMDDAGLVGEVMVAIQPLVVQPRGGTIGSRGQGARSVGAADDFDAEVVDRHDGDPITLQSPRRHDV